VKLLCWWCHAENTVKTFKLDANDTDGTRKKCAKAIWHVLQKMFRRGEENVSQVLYGQATDSGGGGTGVSFHNKLTKQGLTCPSGDYLVSSFIVSS
jgi:hypothetical protein